ncbi:S24 family peptidase, partial [Paraburkholderia sp. SIMBA_049]
DWIPRPQHLSKRAFGLIIQGRSMWPEFKPDEIIYVEPDIAPWDLKDGDLVVIHCNDDKQATFKQLMMGDNPEDMYLK